MKRWALLALLAGGGWLGMRTLRPGGEVRDVPTGRLLAFNGTTEWALDSLLQHEAVWLPREGQLRELLGDRFAGLHRDGDSWAVEVSGPEGPATFTDADPECAYAQALLSIV